MQLTTQRLTLVPNSPAFLSSTAAYACDAENAQMMIFLPHESPTETLAFLQNAQQEWCKPTPQYYEFAVLYRGEHIGGISLYPEGDTVEIGWIINKKYWQMGFGCEAAYAASNYALNVLHVKELVAHCDAANFASRRIMEKLGMELVSTQPGRRNRLAGKESQEALYRLSVPALQDGILGKIVSGHIDRPFGSRHPRHPDMIYPVNYGYADDISAPDGDNQDVYLMGCDHPVCTFSGKVIAVYHRFNDIEDKWIVSADDQPHTNEEILESIRFQEQYFVGVLLR